MTNFEHYKDEIEKAVNDESLFLFLKQRGRGCIAYYPAEITKWYLAEYVEPYKLTKFEKDMLMNLHKSFKFIRKRNKSCIAVYENEHTVGSSVSYLFDIKFDCLEYDKDYKIADILANCEVIE